MDRSTWTTNERTHYVLGKTDGRIPDVELEHRSPIVDVLIIQARERYAQVVKGASAEILDREKCAYMIGWLEGIIDTVRRGSHDAGLTDSFKLSVSDWEGLMESIKEEPRREPEPSQPPAPLTPPSPAPANPETPATPELNEAYFNNPKPKDILHDLEAFANSAGCDNVFGALIKDIGKKSCRAKISNGITIDGDNYLRTAANALKYFTPRGNPSRGHALKTLKRIAQGKSVLPPPTRPPQPVVPPGPITPPPKPDDKTPRPPEPAPVVAPPVVPPVPPPAPHPHPLPVGEGTEPTPEPAPGPQPEPEPSPSPEPAPEATAEAPSFSRYLRQILGDTEHPKQREALLQKLTSDNGRLWIDKEVQDPRGSERTVRIWLSIGLTPEDLIKPKEELFGIVQGKLETFPTSLRFRIDDPTEGRSWKEQWTEKKGTIATAVDDLKACTKTTPPQDPAATVASIAQKLGIADGNKAAFTSLLTQYLIRTGAKDDLWTAVRNAYWHADGWKSEGDVSATLKSLNVKVPTYEGARIRVWEKIAEEPRGGEINGKTAPLFHNGIKSPAATIAKTGAWYHIGPHWVHEEHLRISLRQNPPLHEGEGLGEGTFELMAWKITTTPPSSPVAKPAVPPTPSTPPAVPPTSPSPATKLVSPIEPKGPTTPVRSHVVPPKKGPKPTTPPVTAPDGSKPLPKSLPAPPPAAGKRDGPDTPPARVPKAAPPKAAKGLGMEKESQSIPEVTEITEDMLKPENIKTLTGKWVRFLCTTKDSMQNHALGKVRSVSADGKAITFDEYATSEGYTTSSVYQKIKSNETVAVANMQPWKELPGKKMDPLKLQEILSSDHPPLDLTTDMLDSPSALINRKVRFYTPGFSPGEERQRRIGVFVSIDAEDTFSVLEKEDSGKPILRGYSIAWLQKKNPKNKGEQLAEEWFEKLGPILLPLEKNGEQVIGRDASLTPDQKTQLTTFIGTVQTYVDKQEPIQRIKKVIEDHKGYVATFAVLMDDYVQKDPTVKEPTYDEKGRIIRAPIRAFQLWKIHQTLRGLRNVLSGSHIVAKYLVQDIEDIISLLDGIDPPERELP